jgi:hypothetical protein
MAKAKIKTAGFGVYPEDITTTYMVDIPFKKTNMVIISERFVQYDRVIAVERVRLTYKIWDGISDVAKTDFNARLKILGLSSGKWQAGSVKVERLLGKELCVLAWAAEMATVDELPSICQRWSALRNHERWWLYNTTSAEHGLAEQKGKGWRLALYYALSDHGTS